MGGRAKAGRPQAKGLGHGQGRWGGVREGEGKSDCQKWTRGGDDTEREGEGIGDR
jgi:hypothetical protein